MAEGRWASANRAEVAALMAQETGLPLELLNETVQRDDFSVEPMTPERIAAQQTTADRFLRLGLVPSAVTVGDAAYTEWTPA
jgi:sulfonate transport system substrate-binding protein